MELLEQAVELLEGARGRGQKMQVEIFFAMAKIDLDAVREGKKPTKPGLPTGDERVQILEDLGYWDEIEKNKKSSEE